MTWQKWYFQPGECYLLSEVVGALRDRLRSGTVINEKAKEARVDWMERNFPAEIVWLPFSTGYGASPFNGRCWRTIEGKPLIATDVADPVLKDHESD